MKQRDRLKLYILLTVLVMVVIFVQSAFWVDFAQLESVAIIESIANHFRVKVRVLVLVIYITVRLLEYAVLGSVLVSAVQNAKRQLGIGTPFCIGAVYAVIVEMYRYQAFDPIYSTRDVVISLIGLLIGIAICWTIRREDTE